MGLRNTIVCARAIAAVTLVFGVISVDSGSASAEATRIRIVPASYVHGKTAVFTLPRQESKRVISGQLVVGSNRTALGSRQVRRIAGKGFLRVRLDRGLRRPANRRAGRVALALRIARASREKRAPKKIPETEGASTSSGRLYSASSPFNQPIPSNPSISPSSSLMIQSLVNARAQAGFDLSVGRWTVPTYFADSRTPLKDVVLRKAPPQWGEEEGFLGYPPGGTDGQTGKLPNVMRGVPIPNGAQPDPELDAHMTVIDRRTNCEYDLYGASRTTQGWQAIWANSTRLDGTGVYPYGMGSKASGFAGDAGLVWPEELQAGYIGHALFFAYPYTKSGGPVSPATSSDGRSTIAGAIPEGARVQLDPSLNLSSLGLTPYQRVIAKALQTYGMILGDTGGALSLYAVGRQSYQVDPYSATLPDEDYPDLGKIPVDRFRVLSLPPQQPKPLHRLSPSGCGTFG